MKLHVEMQGVGPGLVMHSDRLADPLDPIAVEKKSITAKRLKTVADEMEIARLEFMGAIYYDKDAGVHIPSANIIRCLYDAATATKSGKKVKAYVHPFDTMIPLAYNGPAEPKALQKLPAFNLRKTVVTQGRRTARTRPIFREWQLAFDLELEDDGLNLRELIGIFDRAGQYIGLGDARNIGYGRFAAKVRAA